MRSTLPRRLLAGAAGVLLGTAATATLAAPAAAQIVVSPDENPADISYEDNCDGTTVRFSQPEGDHHWRVLVGGDVFWGGDPESQDPESGFLPEGETGEVFVPAGEEPIETQWWQAAEEEGEEEGWVSDGLRHDWTEPTDCAGIPPVVDWVTIASCDFFVFIVRNAGEEGDGPISVALTPDQAAVHGHAPAFVPLLDEEPGGDGLVDIPDDAELVDTQEIGGGGTVGPLGPFDPGASHAHGFEAAAGLDVEIVVTHEDEVLVEQQISWDGSLGDLECDQNDGGQGGGGDQDDDQGGQNNNQAGGPDDTLPTTGMPTLLIVGTGIALLALGSGLVLLTRQREEESSQASSAESAAGEA